MLNHLSPRATAVLLSVLLARANAQESKSNPPPEPIVTDRPDFTESASVVPFRRIQLEGGYSFSRIGSTSSHTVGELLLRIGYGTRTEIRIGINSWAADIDPGGSAFGFEDASLGLKLKLLNVDANYGLRRPDVALIIATSLLTGASSFRENALQPEAKLCLGWDLAERCSLSTNFNCSLSSEMGKRFVQFSGSASMGLSLTERIGSYLEYFAFLPASRGGSNANYINSGLTYLVNNDCQLDLRAGLGLNGIRPDYFAGAGISHRW